MSRTYSAGSKRPAARLALAWICLSLGACAGTPRSAPTESLGDSVELVEVPFFPQTDYQCGPAALATVLVHAGHPVIPDALAPAVYIEELRGSLQAELMAATRRAGLVPYPLQGATDALLAEIRAGHPVLVLQNLGLPRQPIWHYAVVVGYDADREQFVLRSGTEARRLETRRRFLRSWARADYWGFVALPPGQLPGSATPEPLVRAVTDSEPWLAAGAAARAHEAALVRWPDHPHVLFAAAGQSARVGDWDEAARRYERLLAQSPADIAARNNLAYALAAQGCLTEAVAEAQHALALSGATPLRAAVLDTVENLQVRAGLAPTAACAAE